MEIKGGQVTVGAWKFGLILRSLSTMTWCDAISEPRNCPQYQTYPKYQTIPKLSTISNISKIFTILNKLSIISNISKISNNPKIVHNIKHIQNIYLSQQIIHNIKHIQNIKQSQNFQHIKISNISKISKTYPKYKHFQDKSIQKANLKTHLQVIAVLLLGVSNYKYIKQHHRMCLCY